MEAAHGRRHCPGDGEELAEREELKTVEEHVRQKRDIDPVESDDSKQAVSLTSAKTGLSGDESEDQKSGGRRGRCPLYKEHPGKP
jgi:hypothetical protein